MVANVSEKVGQTSPTSGIFCLRRLKQ